jgi:hypothetical protein
VILLVAVCLVPSAKGYMSLNNKNLDGNDNVKQTKKRRWLREQKDLKPPRQKQSVKIHDIPCNWSS